MLTPLDITIIIGYFVLTLAVGLWSGRGEKSAEGYLAGKRSVPWWAVLGSIIATEVSAMTFLQVPGVGFSENLTYLQTTIGSILARFFVASLFLSAFYAANCVSIYEYLAQRFGNGSRLTASVFFIVTRLIASGVRLLVAVVAISVIFDINFLLTLIVFSAFSLAYIWHGGIKAVIYTNCLQAVIFIACGIAVLTFLIQNVGFSQYTQIAAEAHKFELLRFAPAVEASGWKAWINDSSLLYVAVLFGFLSTSAAMGTDQDMTQRMLTCKNASEAKKSLISSGFLAFGIAGLFLLVGTALFAYYRLHPDPTLPLLANGQPDPNRVFPHFIAQLPSGIKGLLIVGVLAVSMSSLDSAIAALSSSTVVDLVRPLMGSRLKEEAVLGVSRGFMAVFTVILTLIAWSFKDVGQSYLWFSFKVVGIPYSALLGVFLLGLMTKRGSDRWNIVAMISASALVGAMLYLSETGRMPLAWPWCLFAGTLWTVAVGALVRDETRVS